MAKGATAVAVVAVIVEALEDIADLEFGAESPCPLISAGLNQTCFGLDEPRSNPDDPMGMTCGVFT